jgi:hypothetical protein
MLFDELETLHGVSFIGPAEIAHGNSEWLRLRHGHRVWIGQDPG